LAYSTAAPAGAVAPQALPNFAAIVKANGPAVVNISVLGGKTPVSIAGDAPGAEGAERLPQEDTPIRGVGSGFIVRSDGVVITNAHVVDNAAEIAVKLTDKREFKAKLVGVDKPTDMAVLKIDAHDLPVVRLGDPAQSGVGDWVLAIGSPFGFENSVTAGIISAKSRTLPEEGYVPFLQTDVAVNPGNSGGPLFNLQGEVIGINSQIFSRTGGYQGLSFAVPIDVALKVEQQLLSSGKVSRGRLGVNVQNLNQALADSFGLRSADGVLIVSVDSEGSAAKAGAQSGDIILKLDDKRIQDTAGLGGTVADLHPGSAAKLLVWRGGQSLNLALKVDDAGNAARAEQEVGQVAQNRIGLLVRPLRKDEYLQAGLLVEQTQGPAARAGIRPGDLVLGVNGHAVADGGQLQSFLPTADKHVALLVQRGSERLFVPVELPALAAKLD
jgi:serine protease Do